MQGAVLATLVLSWVLEAAVGQLQVQRTGPLELSVAWAAAGGRLVPAVGLHTLSPHTEPHRHHLLSANKVADVLPGVRSGVSVRIMVPDIMIGEDGNIVAERTFLREGLSESNVVINKHTAPLWTHEGEPFGGLVENMRYKIAVYSGTVELGVVTAMPFVNSAPPKNVRVCAVSDQTYPCRKLEPEAGSLRVAFEAPAYFGGDVSEPLEYIVEVCPAADFAGGVVRSSVHPHAGNVHELASVPGLTPGVRYWARVTAVTEIGAGDVSLVSSSSAAVPTPSEAASRRKAREKRERLRHEQREVIRQRAGTQTGYFLGAGNMVAEL